MGRFAAIAAVTIALLGVGVYFLIPRGGGQDSAALAPERVEQEAAPPSAGPLPEIEERSAIDPKEEPQDAGAIDGDKDVEQPATTPARLAGVVLDPRGSPVHESDVTLYAVGADAARSPTLGEALPAAKATTASDGSFSLDEIEPGVFELRADHADYAPSEKQAYELQPGEEISALELRLFRGGVIAGEIYDRHGILEAGRSVDAWSKAVGDRGSAVSDAEGRFEIGPLAAGPYAITSQADRAEAQVLDAQTVHVVLGAQPADPIRVWGQVSEAGQPVVGGSVSIVPAAGNFTERRDAEVDEEGRYEILIDRPGDVVLLYHEEIFRTPGLDFPTRIPAGKEHRFDLELPSGSIEGIVIGLDGEPASRVSVTLSRDTGLARPTFYGPARGAITAEDGRFRIARIEPGTFSLRIPGRAFRPDVAHAATVLTGVVVRQGEQTVDLRIELKAFGILTGRVIDAGGQPVPEAAIFARDKNGAVLQTITPRETDPTGRFRYEGLPEGEVLVSARGLSAASAVVGPILLRAGEETEIELVVEASTTLRVLLEDQDGAPARARVHLFDSEDRDHAGLTSIGSFAAGRAPGSDASDHRVGPVPAGTYRLVAVSEHGEVLTEELKLGATPEREVRLRFAEQTDR